MVWALWQQGESPRKTLTGRSKYKASADGRVWESYHYEAHAGRGVLQGAAFPAWLLKTCWLSSGRTGAASLSLWGEPGRVDRWALPARPTGAGAGARLQHAPCPVASSLNTGHLASNAASTCFGVSSVAILRPGPCRDGRRGAHRTG